MIATATIAEPQIAEGVLDLVRQYESEDEFAEYLDLVRKCCPNLHDLSVRLLHAGHDRFVEKRSQFPFRLHPAFTLSPDFIAEKL